MAEPGKVPCCWTCKMRHVKCDGATTACFQCNSRQVQCHGYGPMPIWMDGGQNEKQERQHIKDAVKKSFKQKKKLQAHQVRGHQKSTSQERKLAKPTTEDLQLSENSEINIDLGITSSPTSSPPSFQNRDLLGHSFAEPLQYDEASLLMHYLDHVFPYQYPCFDKGRWSRGWLLWLLGKNGPLYRASLGLAALHQRSSLGEISNHHLELEFHTKAIRQLHEFVTSIDINELQPENETLVEIVTCGVALISFEVNLNMAIFANIEAALPSANGRKVLRGSTKDWQPHLCAMASIAVMMCRQPQLLTLPDQPPSPLFKSRGTAAMEFHIPVLLWMDLLACIATRERPKLPYDEWLGPSCTFQLAHIMGCHNSVMKAIGDLAVLSKGKFNSLMVDDLNLRHFHQMRQQIEDGLEHAMDATPMVSMVPGKSPPNSSTTQASDQRKLEQRPDQRCVTRIFAAATLAQLAAVSAKASNVISSTQIRRAVSRVILEIEMACQTVCPRQLSWPICVAGCLADQDQQQFFDMFLNSVLAEGTGMVGNCGTVRDILRACWANKVEKPDQRWDCSSTMEQIGVNALLI